MTASAQEKVSICYDSRIAIRLGAKVAGNQMQRVFQAVAQAGLAGITRGELEQRLPFFEPESVRQALRRLVELEPAPVGVVPRRAAGVTVYFAPPGARPPRDRRGRSPNCRLEIVA